jgi:RNA polymerase sigma factor (sigma-70 family)
MSPEEVVQACLQTGAPAAWEEFVRRFQRLIATVALRTARRWDRATPDVVDELVQETFLKLCDQDARLLRSFDPRHKDALFGYIKVVTANLVHDHFRELNSQKRGAGVLAGSWDTGQDSGVAEPAAGSGARWMERQVLIGEIDAHLRAITEGTNAARDRRIFWLHYRVGLTSNAIAGMAGIGLTIKGVESTLLRLTRQLRQRLATRTPRAGKDLADEGIQASESF